MTRNHPRISAMERDITTKHWLPNDSELSYTWHTLNVEEVAAHYHTSQKTVRETLKRIEAKYPKPVPDTAAELARNSPSGDTCDKCGEPIVWVQFQPCNPRVIRGVSADGNRHTVRENHRETCLPKTEGESPPVGIEASQIG